MSETNSGKANQKRIGNGAQQHVPRWQNPIEATRESITRAVALEVAGVRAKTRGGDHLMALAIARRSLLRQHFLPLKQQIDSARIGERFQLNVRFAYRRSALPESDARF